jgi:uncharacterized Ntn-hydrolase superfamily protein
LVVEAVAADATRAKEETKDRQVSILKQRESKGGKERNLNGIRVKAI